MASTQPRSLVWFRRDLRVSDNSALHHACLSKDKEVIAIYFVTPKQWLKHDDANHKVSFTLGCLRELSESLRELNIPLLIQICDTFEEVPKQIREVCKRHSVDEVFANREYEVYEENRDLAVEDALGELGVQTHSFHDRVVVPPESIATKQNAFYSVFTPYRKVWDVKVEQGRKVSSSDESVFVSVLPKPKKRSSPPEVPIGEVPKTVSGFEMTDVWQAQFPAGEKAGLEKLAEFEQRVSNYGTDRDLPGIKDGTSSLSAYLAAGAVSPRQCLSMIEKSKDVIAGSEGSKVWVSELTWRDFYTHVMVGFPRVSKSLPFKLKTNQLDWRTDKPEFTAWCEGRTGFPIVDAGMRQLNQTGWMHNRLRMVTAMFLTKNLLIDWRLGERYFMQNLIDGDLAANNGGWQWSASTGTDAVPYFRIFNPFSQSKRFDVDGEFIKTMCPELKSVPASALHDPKKLTYEIERRSIDYPAFVVDYKMSRERALAAFKGLG